MMKRPRFVPGNFMLLMTATVVTTGMLLYFGAGAVVFNDITSVAICLLLFMHGAELPRELVIAGAGHRRLNLTVLASPFVVLTLLGWVLKPLLPGLMTPELYLCVLFVCLLPSTVRSIIAFTAVARGNVPAAICAASVSNLLGIFLTSVLVGLLVVSHGYGVPQFDAIRNSALQLLLIFVAGQVARRWIGTWPGSSKALLKVGDQGSILLTPCTAFSEAEIQGLWQQLPGHS